MGLLREDEMKKRLQERKGGERQRTVTGERNRMMFFSVPEELGVIQKGHLYAVGKNVENHEFICRIL